MAINKLFSSVGVIELCHPHLSVNQGEKVPGIFGIEPTREFAGGACVMVERVWEVWEVWEEITKLMYLRHSSAGLPGIYLEHSSKVNKIRSHIIFG